MRHAAMNETWELSAKTGDSISLTSQLASGMRVNALDKFGQSALMLAAVRGHEEACRVLIAAGADLDVTAKYGLSALMLAVVNGHESVARVLASAGADLTLRGVGAPGFLGKTASELARDRTLNRLSDELRS